MKIRCKENRQNNKVHKNVTNIQETHVEFYKKYNVEVAHKQYECLCGPFYRKSHKARLDTSRWIK